VFGSAARPEAIDDLRGKSFASTIGVWRVRSAGQSRVLKHLALGAGRSPTWPSEPELDSQYYWRREFDVYANGLGDAVPFRLPACAAFERADGTLSLWLEDVGDPEPWPEADIADVARRLAAMPAVPSPPRWFAGDWFGRYLDLRAYRFDPDLPFWRRRDEIVERIESGPRVLVYWEAYSGALDPALVPEAEFTFFVGNALRYGWAPAINEHFESVYEALASAAATRLPSFA
jgi:hypothetical protein